jgi:hypothetical protein
LEAIFAGLAMLLALAALACILMGAFAKNSDARTRWRLLGGAGLALCGGALVVSGLYYNAGGRQFVMAAVTILIGVWFAGSTRRQQKPRQ